MSAFIGFGVLGLVVQQGHLLGLTGLDTTGADRDIRAADRVRDPVRPLDGLHGLPHEPDPRGARPRPRHAPRPWSTGSLNRARRRRRSAHHGHGLRGVHPQRGPDPKEFGLLLAVAIVTDALVVRMTLVPAFFTLLGEKTWYIPRWLDRAAAEHHDRAAARSRGTAQRRRTRARGWAERGLDRLIGRRSLELRRPAYVTMS